MDYICAPLRKIRQQVFAAAKETDDQAKRRQMCFDSFPGAANRNPRPQVDIVKRSYTHIRDTGLLQSL
jgi:hypothetical protein